MFKRMAIAGALLASVLVVSAGAAQAGVGAGQTSGIGKTKQGATFGLNAKADLTGEAEYIHPTLEIHCTSYVSYRQGLSADGRGFLKSWVNSDTCYDNDGNRYWAHFEFVDRGEGTNSEKDRACIVVKNYGAETGPTDQLIFDCASVIKNGNVQILPNA